jgi:hypothetical protein
MVSLKGSRSSVIRPAPVWLSKVCAFVGVKAPLQIIEHEMSSVIKPGP